ncbi:AAA family ATPase, partial [Candidatus Woesearchaeota archaeon]|nr:AAA family ATPase [Candidatus Woesearchaeota archaeon]
MSNTKGHLEKVMYKYTVVENGVEDENKILKETLNLLKDELDRFKKNPLMICEVGDIIKDNAIIKIPNGNNFFVSISKSCKDIRPGDSVLVEQKNFTIIERIKRTSNFNVEKFVIIESPNTTWNEIGGLETEIEEIKEVIELPLKKPELFKKVGIQPPKGILLHGEPGTGKTLLAKAVANSTNSTFIEIVGSELVQKFIGEGSKLVKEIFQLAKEKQPSIVFIDELDALAAKRVDMGTSGEREVQRTFMQLLAEIDGFKHLGKVKIIGCTNRIDILDPAILRPGRLDRLIKVPIPNKEGREEIFKIHTKNITLGNLNLQKLIKEMDEFSG